MTVSNAALPVLGADEVVRQLGTLRAKQPVKYWAFYSSQLGGIVTDPALMVIPFDDHMPAPVRKQRATSRNASSRFTRFLSSSGNRPTPSAQM